MTEMIFKLLIADLLYHDKLTGRGSFAVCFEGLCLSGSLHSEICFKVSKAEYSDPWNEPGVKNGGSWCLSYSVSYCDWLCHLFNLFFPRRLLEDYFVVLIDTFKLSIAIIVIIFLSCHNIFHQNFIDFFLWKTIIILIVTTFLYFCQNEND